MQILVVLGHIDLGCWDYFDSQLLLIGLFLLVRIFTNMAHRNRGQIQHISLVKPPKLRKFSGEENTEDFIQETLTLLSLLNLTPKQAATWIIDALEGSARSLIIAQNPNAIDTPQKILDILRAEWGERKTQTTLRKAYYRRIQGSGESVSEYGTAIQALWRKCNDQVPPQEQLSVDSLLMTFIDGLRTAALRRELKKVLQTTQQPLTIGELIQLARDWMTEEKPEEVAQASELKFESLGDELHRFCLDRADTRKCKGNSNPSFAYRPEIDAMQKRLDETQEKIKLLESAKDREEKQRIQLQNELLEIRNDRSVHRNSNRSCWDCGQSGHFSRNCPQRWRKDRSNDSLSGSENRLSEGRFTFGQGQNVPSCWSCGREGHFRSQCPEISESEKWSDRDSRERKTVRFESDDRGSGRNSWGSPRKLISPRDDRDYRSSRERRMTGFSPQRDGSQRDHRYRDRFRRDSFPEKFRGRRGSPMFRQEN